VQRSIDLVMKWLSQKKQKDETNEKGRSEGDLDGRDVTDHSRCMPANATRPSQSSCHGVFDSTSSSSEE
jgi:hypothetical protein